MAKLEDIESGVEGGAVLKLSELLILSKQDIVQILDKLSSEDREEILLKYQINTQNKGEDDLKQKNKPNRGFNTMVYASQLEQYNQLKPVGFEHAPEKAKKYRKELEDSDDVEQMKHLQNILAYNSDNTVGLPTINETFCADLVGGKSMNREASMEVAKSKGYHLLSDWNDKDSEADKKETDWYRLENLFGKYANQGAFFCMLDFDNDRYWTSSKYENEEGVVRSRLLDKDSCDRGGSGTYSNNRVCGFKVSM